MFITSELQTTQLPVNRKQHHSWKLAINYQSNCHFSQPWRHLLQTQGLCGLQISIHNPGIISTTWYRSWNCRSYDIVLPRDRM